MLKKWNEAQTLDLVLQQFFSFGSQKKTGILIIVSRRSIRESAVLPQQVWVYIYQSFNITHLICVCMYM